MPTIKELAAQAGLVVGCGPADPSVPTTPPGWFWYGTYAQAIAHRWNNPVVLDAATDPHANIIVNEIGGALDLCCWARGPIDYSHYGKFERWLGPVANGPSSYDFDGPDQTYAWALANGLRVFMSEPHYSGVPAWIADYDDYENAYTSLKTPAEVTTLLHDWITLVYSRFPNLYATTCLNELRGPGTWVTRQGTSFYYLNSSIGQPGGKTIYEYSATVLGWMRAANPNVKLVMNGYGAEFDPVKAQEECDWAAAVNAAGADIQGIGLQAHCYGIIRDWEAFKQVCAVIRANGFEPHVTEFDMSMGSVPGANATQQGRAFKAFREAAAASDLQTVNMWSIRDPLFYGDPGALYTSDYTPKTDIIDAIKAALTEAPPIEIGASPASFALTTPSVTVDLINAITERFKFPGPLKIWNGTTFADASFKVFDGSTVS
jgi:GH35 family endo-1,4-beta-xylanase